MNATRDATDRQQFPALARSFARAKKIGIGPDLERIARRSLPLPAPPDGFAPRSAPKDQSQHAALEALTLEHRNKIARKHRKTVRESRAVMKLLQAEWHPVDERIGSAAVIVRDRDLMGAPSSERNPDLYGFVAFDPNDYAPEIPTQYDADRDAARNTGVLQDMWDTIRRIRWHDGRDRGQQARFDTVRSCGSRVRIAHCSMCASAGKPVPEGCGVSRVCAKCSLQSAKARRARFGRGRGRALLEAVRSGRTRKVRLNGRFTEKMLTLTVPHVRLEDCARGTGKNEGKLVRDVAENSVHARIAAAYMAWPIFLRSLNHFLSGKSEMGEAAALRRGAHPYARSTPSRLRRATLLEERAGGRRLDRPYITYHRAFEWTPGDGPNGDGLGHPHFHVHLWSPWLPGAKLHAWWAEALRAVGVPIEKVTATKTTLTMRRGDVVDRVVVELRMLRGFNAQAVYELMKGGKRSALELSRLDFEHGTRTTTPVGMSGAVFRRGPGVDAYDYAEGWTIADVQEMCSPEVQAHLYIALEAKRLSQASKGFFVDDPPCACQTCGASAFTIEFQSAAEHAVLSAPEACTLQPPERGPP